MDSTEQTQQVARKPIMLRADLSDEEWLAIRQEALARKTTNAKFVGELIRAGMECIEPIGDAS